MSHYLRIGFIDYRLEIAHASMLYRRLHQRKELCDVIACTALEPEAGRIWAEERGVRYHETASTMEVDALVIPAASNPELHLKLFSAASELGVPLFIDKSFAQDAATGFEILRLARAKEYLFLAHRRFGLLMKWWSCNNSTRLPTMFRHGAGGI